MRVARTEEQPPNVVPIGDTQPVWRIDPRTEDGSWSAYRMSIVGLAVAIVVALAAVGVGVLMLTTSPDSVAGPQGAQGAAGAQGAQGAQGVPGAQGPQGATGPAGATGPKGATGATGKQGPTGPVGAQGPQGSTGPAGANGTITASTAVSGTTVLSITDPPLGTTVTATATCPAGAISLGGGAQVSAPGAASKNVALRSSFPTGTNGWRAVATVMGPLGAGQQMSVHPFVLCGKG